MSRTAYVNIEAYNRQNFSGDWPPFGDPCPPTGHRDGGARTAPGCAPGYANNDDDDDDEECTRRERDGGGVSGRCRCACVEQRRCGGRGGVAQLLGGTDSCRRSRRGVGLRSDDGARQLSVRRQVRPLPCVHAPLFATAVLTARLTDD